MQAVKTSNASIEEADVITTARDHFEGRFEGDAVRMDRALHSNFVKRRAGEELGITTKERMLELTRRGEGKQDAADRKLEIWKIANALWQLAGENGNRADGQPATARKSITTRGVRYEL